MIAAMRYPSDIPVRRRWFAEASFAHPAKLHLGLLQHLLDTYTRPGETILDPMAGIGSILLAATQQRNVIAREIEPQWLALLHENAAEIYRRAGLLAGAITVEQANARKPWRAAADHVIFSPPYGCEMGTRNTAVKGVLGHRARKAVEAGSAYAELWQKAADRHGAGGAIRLHYGQHPDQVGHFRGARYWQAMREIYGHAIQALGSGVLVLILKDHIKDGQRVCVAAQTIALCEELGLRLVDRHQREVYPLSLWQRRRKERGEPVVEEEDALVFRKAGQP